MRILLTALLAFVLCCCCQKALHYDVTAHRNDLKIRSKIYGLVQKSTVDDYSMHDAEVTALKKQLSDAYSYEMNRGAKCNCVSVGMVSILKDSTGALYNFFDVWKKKGKMQDIVMTEAHLAERLDSTASVLPLLESLKIKK